MQKDIEGTIVTVSREYLYDVLASSQSCLQSLDKTIVIEQHNQEHTTSVILTLFRQPHSEYRNR